MYGPESRRQRTQLNTLNATLFDERDWILEVVVGVLRAVGCEDASGRHRFTVNCFNDAEFVWSNLNERHFANYPFKRKLDQVQSGLEHVGLNTDFAFGGDDAARRHLGADISSLLDRDFAGADVNEDALHEHEEQD